MLICKLIYPIQFDPNPLDEQVISRIIGFTTETESQEDLRCAIALVLAKKHKLSEFIPQPHSEEVIRNFLFLVSLALGL